MKKNRIFCIICILIFTMINSMPSFAAESGDDYEDITEEYTYGDTTESSEDAEDGYPSHYFNDTTIPGIIIEANVGEGIIPAQTSIRTKLVSSEVEERVKNSIEGFFNGDQKAVKITAVDIGFVYNNVEIEPKESINIIMRSDQALERANHVVVCLKDDQAELLPASQSVIDDYAVNDEGISLRKKEFSFELKGNATIAIVEIEDVPADQKKTDTSEIPSEATSETKDTETPEPSSETKDTETPEPSSETEDTKKPEPSSETEDTKKPEPSSKQKETSNSVDKNEKINISVELIFNDNNDQDGIRPKYRQVVILSNGVKKSEIRVTEEDHWRCIFENLQKFESGKEVHYEIQVLTPTGYDKPDRYINNNNFKFTYVHTPATINIEGHITWDDFNNKYSKRPSSCTVILFADDIKTDSFETSKDINWKIDFGEYPKFKDGKKIKYTIKSETVDGYYEPDYNDEFNVINKVIDISETENKTKAPKVGDKKNIIFRIGFLTVLLFASGSGIVLFIKRMNKEEDEEHEDYEEYEEYEDYEK